MEVNSGKVGESVLNGMLKSPNMRKWDDRLTVRARKSENSSKNERMLEVGGRYMTAIERGKALREITKCSNVE